MATRSDVPRGVIDTSVLVAGIAGFKPQVTNPTNPSALLLRRWMDKANFVWLVSEEIINEYKHVLARLGVRRHLIGSIINYLREEAEWVEVTVTVQISPDPDDNPFCACAELGKASFIATLNPKDFPQPRLRAKVIPPHAEIPTTRRRRRISNG